VAWLLVVFHNLLRYWDFQAQPFLGFTKEQQLVDARGQRRMGRLIQADRRATLTEITTRYN